jgi:DNA-binding NarL/FixJ family response regulator
MCTMSVPAIDPQTALPVAICERRQFDRAALRVLCSHDEGLRLVAEAAEGDELLEQLTDLPGLVILIGRSTLRQESGLVGRIRAVLPHARIVVVAIGGELAPASAADMGVDGMLPRDGELADQLAAVYG